VLRRPSALLERSLMQKAMLKVTTELRWLRRLSAVAVLVKLKLELKAAIAKEATVSGWSWVFEWLQ
jgi:hypothetical protein